MTADDETRPTARQTFGTECQALLEVSESIASHRDLEGLFHDLAERLHRVVNFDFLALVLHDEAKNVMRLHILESRVATDIHAGSELPVEQSPGGVAWRTQEPVVISDIDNNETRFPALVDLLKGHGVKSLCVLPLTTAQRRLGALGFGSLQARSYSDSDLGFLPQVARHVALAVDNALNYENAQSYQRQLARERDRLGMLLEVNNAVVSNLELRDLFTAIAAGLRRVMQHEYTSLALHDPERNVLSLYALDFPESKGFFHEEMIIPLDESSPPGRAFNTRKPLLLGMDDAEKFSAEAARRAKAEGLKSGCILPLVSRDRALGTLNVASLRENAFTPDDLELLTQVANQVAIAVDNALAFRQIAALKEKLAEEKLYLEDEIRGEHNFEEIIGESPALKRVLRQAETVAPTDAAVLIQGETGTGKEVVARAVHNLSRRRDRTFVKVNCSAIPSGLLESELFGHERGAFTGAIAQKIGRFELAHQGTLFLDEVGDIPLELQPKLLRALQEQEFERLGSSRTVRVNVRLVAATNRPLTQMIAEGLFRSDLFYRLNVFPITVPPLRERRDDIPSLVRYFAQKYARRMDKPIETIPAEALDALTAYPWPGNVRELENFIERAVILSPGSVLRVSLGDLRVPVEAANHDFPVTLEAA
ncbi:MAG TPA: sigma 54-interacting transcriptional regulator, partial [Terriglobia bacterium]|nr:sigma 54-interacting transcriptional regulator [Terriglobia bacterium]